MDKVIIILDEEEGTVDIRNYYEQEGVEVEEFIDDLGHSSSNCNWMIVNNLKLTIDV